MTGVKNKKIMYIFIAFGIILLAIYAGSMLLLKVTGAVFSFEDLPKAFDGFRILHISDLHANSPNSMNMDIWAAAGELDFDMAVITGDIATSSFGQIKPHEDGIRKLCERVPVYYVPGNHENRNGFTPEMADYLGGLGVKVLINQLTSLTIDGGLINIIGLDDYDTLKKGGLGTADELMEKAGDGFKLVIEHQPQLFSHISRYGNMLQLSGHTHGGQVRLPFLPTLYAPGQGFLPKYGAGAYIEGTASLYISSGIGTTSFPVRFWNRPELAVITLRKT